MAIINKNTSGQPMTALGRTGAQVIRFIDAPRVYIKAADSVTNASAGTYLTGLTGIAAKSNGVTPTGWTDLGIVNGKVKVDYSKKVNEIKTGVDQYFRAAYATEKAAKFEFTLDQFDDVVLEQITGLSPTIVSSGSVMSYLMGSDDLFQRALLLVAQNKLDGKEWQFYNPATYINFAFESANEQMTLKVMGLLPFFTLTPGATDTFMYQTIFA